MIYFDQILHTYACELSYLYKHADLVGIKDVMLQLKYVYIVPF